MSLRAWLALSLLCVLACGSRAPRTRTALDAARMQRAGALKARERAPELWRQMERAQAAARDAGEDEAARADQLATARLWLEAAIVACERADIAAQRLVVEREIEGMYAAALRDQRSAQALEDELAREASAEIAREEVKRALERAALIPARRPKLDKQAEAEAARALIARASLVLEAARALGAEEKALDAANVLIERAQGVLSNHPEQALEYGDRALSQALMTLGPVRAKQTGVSPSDKRALLDDLGVLGARIARGDQGLIASIEDAFARERLSASAMRTLSRVCAVAEAHPHGPIRVVVSSDNTQAGARKSSAVMRALTDAGCKGERFGVAVREASSTALELHFVAY